MKKSDDLKRLAESLRAELDACQDKNLKVALLLRLVVVVEMLRDG